MSKETWDILVGIANVLILIITSYFMWRSLRSPIDAVKVGRALNNEQQKDNAKRNLFLTLFALRGSPVHIDYVRALNEIDVVFEDVPSVLEAWHIHYDSLQIKGQINENQIWDLQRTNLLSEMALHLGYNRIRQTDMIRSYYPQGHENQTKWDFELRFAAQNYFELGRTVFQEMLNNTPSYKERKEKEQNNQSEKEE